MLDINNVFSYHKLNEEQQNRCSRMREVAKVFADVVQSETPASREQSIALTHIQTALMFANAAIAINEGEI